MSDSAIYKYNEKVSKSVISSFSSAAKEQRKHNEKNKQVVEQFAHKAELLFPTIDNMVRITSQIAVDVGRATNNSAIGASECIAGINKILTNLGTIRHELGGSGRIVQITGGGGGTKSADMIHVGAWLNKVRNELNQQACVIQEIAGKYDAAESQASGIGQTDDIGILLNKMNEETKELLDLSHKIQQYAAVLGEFAARYLELQTEALAKAMQIPH